MRKLKDLIWLIILPLIMFGIYTPAWPADSKVSDLTELPVGTIVDGDWFYVIDMGEAEANRSKKYDWSSLKGDMVTYFDTIYPTSVGNCTAGACLDGSSSNAGTYIRLWDGTSAYESLTGGVRTFTFASSTASAENLVLTLGANDNTLAMSSTTGANALTLTGIGLTSTGFFAGVNDTTYGGISLYGAAVTNGGWIDLYTAGNFDTTINKYSIKALEDRLEIGPDTDSNAIALGADKYLYITDGGIYVQDGGVTKINMQAAGTSMIAVGVDDLVAGNLTLYGADTFGGGSVILQTPADSDTTIAYYAMSVRYDELYIGPNTNTNALTMTGSNVAIEGTLTAGAAGFTVGAAGDVTGKSFTSPASATPSFTFEDSDAGPGTAGIYGMSAGGAYDVVMSLGVEDSASSTVPTVYIEIDGVTETIDLLKPVVITGAQLKIPSSDANPTSTAGYFRHDTTITNFTNGGLVYYNGAVIKQVVDMTTATASACTEGQVVTYDATSDLWKCTTAPGTGDFKADGTVPMTAAITLSNAETISNADDTEIAFNGTEAIALDLDTGTANQVAWKNRTTSSTGITDMSFSALNLVTTGTINGAIKIEKDDNSLAAEQCYGTFHWLSGGAETTTLPAAVVGMNLCFYASDATVKHIDPNGTDTIVLTTAALAAGYQIESPGAAGDFICLVSFTVNQWTALGRSGVWITHGAD